MLHLTASKKTYIVGGLTDRRYTKGPQTSLLAKKLGIPTVRFPLDAFYKNTRYGADKTLNIDTSVQLLSTYLDVRNWSKSFDLILPPRYCVRKWP